jgi:hypothetical protein
VNGADGTKRHDGEHWVSGNCRYLLHDRDTKYCASFRGLIEAENVKALALPPKSPNLNAFAERWVRSVKEECLSKLILFGERSPTRALHQYEMHYHQERNHQCKNNTLVFTSSMQWPEVSKASMPTMIGWLTQVLRARGRMTRTDEFFDHTTPFWSRKPKYFRTLELRLACVLPHHRPDGVFGGHTHWRGEKFYLRVPPESQTTTTLPVLLWTSAFLSDSFVYAVL